MSFFTKNKLVGVTVTVAALMVTVLSFQNCGKLNGYSQSSLGTTNPNLVGLDVDGSGTPALTATSDGVTVSNDSSIVQIQGQCSQNGGVITVTQNALTSDSCGCDPIDPNVIPDNNTTTNGSFTICAIAPSFGLQNFTITQTNDIHQTSNIEVPIRITFPVVVNVVFEITSIVLVGTTGADFTINCVPGSIITADAYGANMLSTPSIKCEIDGNMVVPVRALIPAGSGNRVVTFNQTYAGRVTSIREDVDDKSTTHTCSIDQGIANMDICVDSAGTVKGSCKAGEPVKIYVNGTFQQAADCSTGKFVANDVLLTSRGKNTIKITQKTPFESADHACSATVEVENIVDINR